MSLHKQRKGAMSGDVYPQPICHHQSRRRFVRAFPEPRVGLRRVGLILPQRVGTSIAMVWCMARVAGPLTRLRHLPHANLPYILIQPAAPPLPPYQRQLLVLLVILLRCYPQLRAACENEMPMQWRSTCCGIEAEARVPPLRIQNRKQAQITPLVAPQEITSPP